MGEIRCNSFGKELKKVHAILGTGGDVGFKISVEIVTRKPTILVCLGPHLLTKQPRSETYRVISYDADRGHGVENRCDFDQLK